MVINDLNFMVADFSSFTDGSFTNELFGSSILLLKVGFV
jgi:hypothetical protein